MTYKYCTTEDILSKVGVPETDIGHDKINRILDDAEKEVDRLIKTTCNPIVNIEILNGNDKSLFYLNKLPLISVKGLKIGNTNISLDKIKYNQTGGISLNRNAEMTHFTYGEQIIVKYAHGWLEETNLYETQSAVLKGEAEIPLNSVEFLTIGNWIRIVGMDGNQEWTQIKNIDKTAKTITCDLIYDHEEGSRVSQGDVPLVIRKLTAVIGGIMGSVWMVGSTYDFATGYTVPDYSVQKGEPYPAFLRVIDDLIKERDFLLKEVPSFPVFA